MNDLDWVIGSGAEPNWILVSIFGAALGALFAEFGAIVAYPLRRLRRDVLEGTWHQFNYTHHSGRLFLNRATLEIKKGLLGGLRGTMADQSGTLIYGGRVRREAGHIVAELKATAHEETLTLRFIATILTPDAVMPGIWMAYDRDSYPAAGAALLSRDDLNIGKARHLIEKWSVSRGFLLRLAAPTE
jgi:hypothetical protein